MVWRFRHLESVFCNTTAATTKPRQSLLGYFEMKKLDHPPWSHQKDDFGTWFMVICKRFQRYSTNLIPERCERTVVPILKTWTKLRHWLDSVNIVRHDWKNWEKQWTPLRTLPLRKIMWQTYPGDYRLSFANFLVSSHTTNTILFCCSICSFQNTGWPRCEDNYYD